MGLDVYAGTFTRYYAHNWKTASQMFCEENGILFQQIRADYTPPPPAGEIQEGVNDWQEQLIRVLQNSGVSSAEIWEENNEKPYFTDKPDWDALDALLLYADAKLLGKDFPKEFPKKTKINSHPLMKKIGKGKQVSGWSLFKGVCHWIPINDSIMFNFPLANGISVDIATTALLKFELSKINEIGWNSDSETIIGWRYTEGYPNEATVRDGKVEFNQVTEVYDTESLAKFAFSVLWQAMEFSEKERVPVILDY